MSGFAGLRDFEERLMRAAARAGAARAARLLDRISAEIAADHPDLRVRREDEQLRITGRALARRRNEDARLRFIGRR